MTGLGNARSLCEVLRQRPEFIVGPALGAWILANCLPITFGKPFILSFFQTALGHGNAGQAFPITYACAVLLCLFAFAVLNDLNWPRRLLVSIAVPFAFIQLYEIPYDLLGHLVWPVDYAWAVWPIVLLLNVRLVGARPLHDPLLANAVERPGGLVGLPRDVRRLVGVVLPAIGFHQSPAQPRGQRVHRFEGPVGRPDRDPLMGWSRTFRGPSSRTAVEKLVEVRDSPARGGIAREPRLGIRRPTSLWVNSGREKCSNSGGARSMGGEQNVRKRLRNGPFLARSPR